MKYFPEGNFPLGSIITHTALGTGKVIKHVPPNKMDVEFEEGVKRLVCGKISGVAPTEYNDQQAAPLKYSPYGIFQVGDIIQHIRFGTGEVVKYIHPANIDVEFSVGIRRLKCGRHPKKFASDYLSLRPGAESKNKIVLIEEHGGNNVCNHVNGAHSETCRAEKLSGFDSNSISSNEILQQVLDDWDYDTVASAYIAYSKPSVERLQLLRQIAELLKSGMGFSQLYNMLELRRGQPERERAYAAGKRLQPWTGLTSSARLRSFVEEHEDFLCGRVVNGKWEPNPLPQGNGILRYTINNELHETPPSNDALAEKLTQILSIRFPNGYRLDSPIELVRFKSFATEILNREIILSDEDLKKRISACGITYDGKVYAISVEVENRINDLVEEYFAAGAQVIFFAEFYSKNEMWLFESSIISEEMLLVILSRLFHKLSFTQTYFGHTSASVSSVVEHEILRVWGDDVLLTYEQLAERLQYIPIERIRLVLVQNKDFIWHRIGTFSHISRIYISDEESETIRQVTTQECSNRGYISLATLDTEEIEARNSELSITAVHNAIFRICLSDKFDNHGKIVTRKGDRIDALGIMKEYCRTIEKCSLDDLFKYEKELTGSVNRWISMDAGNTILVRIDRDTYVSDKYVYFDSDAVDIAIEMFITNNYLPLKSFTTFGTFPECGQTWNLFLLESYCRRFSKKFRFDSLSVNSQNIGAIIRKTFNFRYIDILANAIISVGVPLTGSDVGKFLLDSGYIGRKRASVLGEVIDKAKAIQQKVD